MGRREDSCRGKGTKLVELWNSESWGPMRANQLWAKASDRFFTSKSDFYVALDLLQEEGFLTKQISSRKRVWYYLSDDYQKMAKTVSILRQHLDSLSLPKEFSASDSSGIADRVIALHVFKILVDWWKLVVRMPIVEPRFRGMAYNAARIYMENAVVRLWEVGTRYPDTTNFAVALVEGMMDAIAHDLFQITWHYEDPVDAETRTGINRAQRELANFRDGKPMELHLIKDLSLEE